MSATFSIKETASKCIFVSFTDYSMIKRINSLGKSLLSFYDFKEGYSVVGRGNGGSRGGSESLDFIFMG